MTLLLASIGVLEVVDSEALQEPAEGPGDGVVVPDQVGGGDRGHREGQDHDADDSGAHLAARQAE